MNVIIKFKELKITEATSVNDVCKKIEQRNPDVIIDEAYKDDAP
jgi:predicted ATP-dependent serine protease